MEGEARERHEQECPRRSLNKCLNESVSCPRPSVTSKASHLKLTQYHPCIDSFCTYTLAYVPSNFYIYKAAYFKSILVCMIELLVWLPTRLEL